MQGSTFRRPYDLSDEANPFGYSEFEPFNEPESNATSPATARNNDAVSTTAAGNVAQRGSARPRPPAARAGPPAKRDLMAFNRVMDMTTTLQSEQERSEAQAAAAAEAEALRLREERNSRWNAVKARMSARPTPLHSVRAYDSDWSDSSEDEAAATGADRLSDVQSMRSIRSMRSTTSAASKRTALDALAPTLAEERAVRAGALYAKETVPVRVMHFIYNWFMYVVYAMSTSLVPGVDALKGSDPKEYYNRKKYA